MGGPFLLGGQQLDDRGLDNRHQGHVRIGRDHDRAGVVAPEVLADEDGGGAVGRADDADRGGVFELKAEQAGQRDGDEDAQLRRRAENQQVGALQQRAEVDHRADADEQKEREELVCDTGVVEDV